MRYNKDIYEDWNDINEDTDNKIADREEEKKAISRYDTCSRKEMSFIDNKVTVKKLTSRSANSLFLLLRICRFRIDLIYISLMITSLFLTCASAYKEQKFAMEPQDQSAVIGSRVTLPCRVENKAGQLQWTKDDFGLGTHRHLVGYDRYKMIGSDEEGDYSLDIRELTLDDDALYQCQVSTGPRGEPAIRSRSARLLVLMPPEPPKILGGSTLEAIEDREVNLECISVGGKPAAEITWVDNDGGVITQGVTYTVHPMSDRRRFTARSTLRLRPRKHHHNQTFTCQAQNTADRAYRAASVKLQVQYAPRVRTFIKMANFRGRIQEGDDVVIGCQAHANPNSLNYKWYVNNEIIGGAYTNELVLKNISRKYNEASIKCEAYNTVGKSADRRTLEVSYGPTFVLKPQNVEGEVGSTVTLQCAVDGHPKPVIKWTKFEAENFNVVGNGPNLTLTVSQSTSGQYWCQGRVEGYSEVEASANVYMKGPPKIISNRTQYGLEGDSVRIECVSFSIPKPDYVMWTRGGNEINSFHNDEYAFLEETMQNGVTKSTLIIRESESKHFGSYNCSVTNLYGTDSLEIILLRDKSFPLILIVSGCASALVVILILMLVIMMCQRKTKKVDIVKKPDITNVGKACSDTFKDSDRSSNISDLKMELRQVEGNCDLDNSNAGSETEFHSNLHLTSNLGLPLAGPVPLPEMSYDTELINQYQRYSGDFNQPINNLHFKVQGQCNGYVPYVDYSRDYVPPSESNTGSLSRSINSANLGHSGALQRPISCGRLSSHVGPDLIPMGNPGVVLTGGLDVRYAATYGNPYLRGSEKIAYSSPMNSISSMAAPAPPPYYSIKCTHPLPVTSGTSPSSSSSSRPIASPLASSTTTASSAQPQVPKTSPQNAGALYILPPSTQNVLGRLSTNQVTTKGNGTQLTSGTHV